jgi:FKBP-type peptidyl-prolyl cis-trans isomerase
MMIKIKYALGILVIILAVTVSCKKDDPGVEVIPPRDRGEEAIRAQAEIEEFLETHFYNYEDFEADPQNFKLKFDTIAGDNASKTPLIQQVTSKEVKDLEDADVTYKLYYLKVRQGEGERPHFSDNTFNTYDGRLMNLDLFDSSVIPVRFNLVDNGSSSGIIRGLQQVIIEFNGAGNVISNPDGTLTFEDYGIGAAFIPSGLAYYQYGASGGLNAYDQVIFSFELFESEVTDHDEDGIPSYMEDLNGNGYLMDDNTDNAGAANYLDDDDDNDGRLTKYEIEIDGNGNITFPDVDGDGIPDYLDSDS